MVVDGVFDATTGGMVFHAAAGFHATAIAQVQACVRRRLLRVFVRRGLLPDDDARAMAQIVPVPPRPFPDSLRDPDLLPPRRPPSDHAAIDWGLLSVVGIPIWLYGRWKRWRARSESA